jgi:hypothetical protein
MVPACDLREIQTALACASNGDLLRLGRALYPGEPERVAGFRAAALRLYAIRMTAEEWSELVLRGAPAVIMVDESDAALLGELLRHAGNASTP